MFLFVSLFTYFAETHLFIPQCPEISHSQRVDCFPDGGASKVRMLISLCIIYLSVYFQEASQLLYFFRLMQLNLFDCEREL